MGDTVTKDQGLLTLESDKATLEVPAPFAGVVKELKVKLGDTLSEGSVVAIIEAADGAPAAAPATSAPKAVAPVAETGAKVEPVACLLYTSSTRCPLYREARARLLSSM